jgi:hypothetical protein
VTRRAESVGSHGKCRNEFSTEHRSVLRDAGPSRPRAMVACTVVLRI